MSCELPFWREPTVLHDFSFQYKPVCEHSAWNFVARFVVLSFFLGLIASAVGGMTAFAMVVLGGCILAFVIMATTPSHQTNKVEKKTEEASYHELPYTATVEAKHAPHAPHAPHASHVTEHFVNGGGVQPLASPIGVMEVDAAPYSGAALPDYTPPTARNLFMNVLVDEMKYNPDRPEAAPIGHPTVKQTMDDFFRIQWFSDPTDVFGKNQGQRQFITQPSTTVPNDQGSFADWLYKIPGKTCKEGGRAACVAGTDGGPIPWMNHTS